MLTISFENPNTSEKVVLGPTMEFRLIGNSLRMGLNEEEVGMFHHGLGCWFVGDYSTTVLSIESAGLQFINDVGYRSKPFGPFEQMRLIGNTLRLRRASDRPLATLEPTTQLWRVVADDSTWTSALITPGPPPRRVVDPFTAKLEAASKKERRLRRDSQTV